MITKTDTNKFGLHTETLEKFHSVFRRYPEIKQVIIYGSRALGNYRNGSDIDITIKGENLTHKLLLTIMAEIDELNTPYFTDISYFDNIKNDALREHILRVGKVFYQAE